MADKINNTLTKTSTCTPPKNYGKKGCCMKLEKPPQKPDPAIYSQQEIISQGMIPTWNNPDIITNHWNEWTLDKEPEVTIKNLSTTTAAINTRVTFSYAQFGIGFNKIQVSSQLIHVPAGGAVNIKFPLPQTLADGPPNISTWVDITHSSDSRLTNNAGMQTVFGAHTSKVGRHPTFTFPVYNNTAVAQNISLVTYANELSAIITPNTFQLSAFEQRMVNIQLHVPDHLHAASSENLMKEVSVAAFTQQGILVGGLTYIIKIDN